VDLLVAMPERGIGTVEVRPEVEADYVRRHDEAHEAMIWTHPGMRNWYRNAAGRVVSALPWRIVDYWRMTREPDLREYRTDGAGYRAEPAFQSAQLSSQSP
jgi:4-hydroxyacetophenone monooxygenase